MIKDLNSYIDHTLLKADASEADIKKLCSEAKEHSFYAVCVNSRYVALCRQELSGSDVRIAAVVGFPLGASASEVKAFEAEYAARQGASEIDMVIALGMLKAGDDDAVFEDIKAVVDAASRQGAIVKVILETGELRDEEIVRACRLSERAGAGFVKSSTGFGRGGAEARHIALMRRSVSNAVSVKASGGIRDRKTALEMIKAGADRIGSSAGIKICEEN